MYQISKHSWDQITMKAKALLNGQEVEVHATWTWAPQLTWYDDTNHKWIYSNEWKFV